MKNIFYSILISFISLAGVHAQTQDLIFDANYNSGALLLESFDPLNQGHNRTTRMKQHNDSSFLWAENTINWQTNIMDTKVAWKIIKSDGIITQHDFVQNSYPLATIPAGAYDITDLVTNGNKIYVLRNELYDDNGSSRYKIRVFAYDALANGTYNADPTFGSGSAIFISEVGSDLFEAKGTMLGDSLVVAYKYRTTGPNQVGCAIVSPTGTYSIQLASNNSATLNSDVVDVIAVNKNEIYIADNAIFTTVTSGVTTYTDVSRVVKWDFENNSFSSDYTGNGTGKSVTLPWNTQAETPFNQDYITKMLIENGKIIVTGFTRHNDGSPYGLYRGRVSRLNSNGTLDNTFATSGTYNQDFTANYFRWQFNDLSIATNGKYYLSGSSVLGSPNSPSQSLILTLDNAGALITTYGNNGFLYETTNIQSIESMIIIPGNDELTNKYITYGNSDEGNRYLGRLVWGTTVGIDENETALLKLYPNPTMENLNIESTQNENALIFNSMGQTVLNLKLKKGINTISVQQLETGIYFIQTENGATQKFIKQ